MVLDRSKKNDLTPRSAEIASRSPFWRYFHDRLHWPAIFRPGPLSALAKGLALYMDDVREDILWLRRQWHPATADDALMAAYGASRGIIRQRFDTDETYRRRVVQALAWHKLGGKWRGLERIYAQIGFAALVLPSAYAERWAHFRLKLDVSETGWDQDVSALAIWLANEYKAARSKLEGILTVSRVPLDLRHAVGVATADRVIIAPWMPGDAPPLSLRTACGAQAVTRITLRPWRPAPPAPRLTAAACPGLTGHTRVRIAPYHDGVAHV